MSGEQIWLCFTLESAATFGRGDGIPGLIDREVTLDGHGCPFLHGRTLKGLLNESCADILYALNATGVQHGLTAAADVLFGAPGSTHASAGKMHVGHARLPAPPARRYRPGSAPGPLDGNRGYSQLDGHSPPDCH
jgi:CRISPR/Cas system CMR subunit Cmr4 (Cas7 group RAMP superfamily)